MKRLRRGTGAKLILKGEKNWKPIDWKSFLCDDVMILLHYASNMTGLKIFFDTGTGNHKRLIGVGEITQGYTPKHTTPLFTS